MISPLANLWGHNNIGEGTKIGAFCDIGNSKIGKKCKIQCHVSIPSGVTIGDNVFIGPGVRFANDKMPKINSEGWIPVGAKVGNNVVIGMGSMIGAGVTIGDAAFIGMGSVVTKDIPQAETWYGNPAHKV